MTDRTDTPASSRSIGEDTTVRASLGRTIAIAAALVIGGVSAGIAYAKLDGRIDRLNGRIDATGAALKTHAEDQNVHLDSLYHMGHGRPVGNFDFTTSIERLTNALGDVQKRPVLIGGDCRKVPGGVLCEQKKD